MNNPNSVDKDARLLDLPFCQWSWHIPSNKLILIRNDHDASCFEPFVNSHAAVSSGWEQILSPERAAAFSKELVQQLSSLGRAHARLHLASATVSRTIILHALVASYDDQKSVVNVTGLARPEFQFGGNLKPNEILENTDFEERRRLEALLLKTQRFEAVAKLAGGIAHDLNNLIAPIRMATELMQRKLTDDSLKRYINIITDSTERARSVIQQILTFSRGVSEESHDPIQPNETIWELRNMISETFPPRISLDFRLGRVPTVRIDPNQLHQALLNILINARDAIAANGYIQVTSYTKHFDIEVRIGDRAINPGRYACIQISDSGEGIPDAIRDRIFDPFFTTKKKNEGTGLGLASVYGIIANANGFIDVDSTQGKGSTFKIYLPESIQRPKRSQTATDEIELDLEGRKIIIVDDEANNLEAFVQTCVDFGMDVLGFVNPEAALQYLQTHTSSVDFALVDLHMPFIGGDDLIRKMLASQRVQFPILTTGDLSWSTDKPLPDAVQILHKPFTSNDLLLAFKNAMDD